MVNRKVAEKERIPCNFGDVISGQQKKKQADHNAHTPGLSGSDIKKARQRVGQ